MLVAFFFSFYLYVDFSNLHNSWKTEALNQNKDKAENSPCRLSYKHKDIFPRLFVFSQNQLCSKQIFPA